MLTHCNTKVERYRKRKRNFFSSESGNSSDKTNRKLN